MPENAVEVRFGANVEGLRSGVREASGHIDSLRGSLLDIKAEATQTGRAARFFANDLASLIPAADGAKGAIRDLFEIVLSGGILGAAIGSVKLLVGVFKELGEEERKAAEDFEKFVEDSKKQTEQLHVTVQKMLLEMQGATRAQLLLFDQTHEARQQEKTKLEELTKAQADLVVAKQDEAVLDAYGLLFKADDIEAREKQIVKLRDQLQAIRDIIEAKKKEVEPVAAGDSAKAAQEIALTQSIEEAKRAALQATVDADINLQRIKTEQEKGLEREKALFDEQLANEIAEAKRRADQATEASAINLGRIETEQRTLTKQQIKELKLELHELGGVAKEIGLAIGESFAAMASDSASAAKVIVDALKTVIKSILEMAIKMVMARAATAAAGAAESQSWIPGVGPFLAIGAIAAVEGAVLALLSLIPSAAGGFDIPHGMNPVTQLHGGEMVLPADIADPLRAQLGGGGGGGDLHITINAVDGESVRRLVESADFLRAIAEVRRNGRMR